MSPVEIVLALALAAALFWISYNHVRFERVVTCVLDLAEEFAKLQDEVHDLDGVKNRAAHAAQLSSARIWERELTRALNARDRAVAALSDHFLAHPPEDSFVTPAIRSAASGSGRVLSATEIAQAFVRLDDGLRRAREATEECER